MYLVKVMFVCLLNFLGRNIIDAYKGQDNTMITFESAVQF